jgi:hypothetical protein
MKDTGCTCQKCGAVYRLDLMVNDHLWLKLTGNIDKGLWCASCIVKAIEELEGFSAYELLKIWHSIEKQE